MDLSLGLKGARRNGADLAVSLHRLRAVVACVASEMDNGPLAEALLNAQREIDNMVVSLDSLAMEVEGLALAVGAPLITRGEDD